MSKNRLVAWIIMFIAALIIVSFLIPKKTNPSPDTRIILEHTYHTYIAPTCYQQSDPTNYIQDSTLGEAKNLNYKPHDSCTEKAFESEKDSLLISFLKDIGVLNKTWDNW
ncbi:hypothetical protein [Oceanobacillus profundus]|uniref:hypothetical protein n=1 Tax=Oceanobacillus profundus TaxID=372463 RepID=UPI0026E1E450|nr:hypothetical protein [Oceanobacillus profundus]MDO6449430.1 hypothetical protein [Oceanobacillus profundus]